jgi:hypothetical protein
VECGTRNSGDPAAGSARPSRKIASRPIHSLGETGFVNEPGTVVAKQCVLQRFPDATVLREYSWGQLWPTGPSSPFRSATPNTRLER